jgi:hypothetical protein
MPKKWSKVNYLDNFTNYICILIHFLFVCRFDVSGVHPKSKYPGTFTEIPYDKYSIDDLVSIQP